MAMSERSIVVGIFTERAEADRAIEELQNAGFRDDQIKVEQHEDAATPVATPGGVAGGIVGGLPTPVGLPAGTAESISTPDDSKTQGGFISRIKRLFAGRTDARIVDDLVAIGVPEEEARYYQSEFELGRIIVAVEAGDRRADALVILRSNGAYDVTTPQGTPNPNAQAGTTTPDTATGTDDPHAQPGTSNPTVSRETNDPTGTDDALVRPET